MPLMLTAHSWGVLHSGALLVALHSAESIESGAPVGAAGTPRCRDRRTSVDRIVEGIRALCVNDDVVEIDVYLVADDR